MELPELQHLDLGDLPLSGGGSLEDARLAFRTWGEPSATAILLPSYYTGTSASQAALIGPGRALDPGRHFIVATDLFGNGNSTSPSHLDDPAARLAFPDISVSDNVAAQRCLLDHLGVERLSLVQGWSLAAIQAWHWAVLQPDMVEAILPVCGATGCWPLNRVFLSGLLRLLEADPAFAAGVPGRGAAPAALRNFGRVYAGWAYSAAFYRDARWEGMGHDSLEDFLRSWEEDHLGWDPHDLAAALKTWMSADLAAAAGAGSIVDLLAGVRARVIAMPCDTDRYFTEEENRIECDASGAELRVIRSDLGHCAGAPARFPCPTAEIEAAARELLSLSV